MPALAGELLTGKPFHCSGVQLFATSLNLGIIFPVMGLFQGAKQEGCEFRPLRHRKLSGNFPQLRDL